jgi:hypothetical protein
LDFYGGMMMMSMTPNPANDIVEFTFTPEEEVTVKTGKINTFNHYN